MCNYHKVDAKIMEYDMDSIEFKFGIWIHKKEYGQRLNEVKSLPKGQFYMSVRVVAKDINVSEMVARRLIKQFTKLDIIRLVSTSKSPKEGSIYEYLVALENNTVDNTVETQFEHSKSEEISTFADGIEHSKNTIDNTVYNTSKNNIKIKEKDISIINNTCISKMQTIIDKWNSLGLAKIKSINTSTNRYKLLNARIKEHGIEQVLEAIDNINKSSFLKGQNKNGWVITFDWFIKPNNFLKVLEGNYKDRETQKEMKQIYD